MKHAVWQFWQNKAPKPSSRALSSLGDRQTRTQINVGAATGLSRIIDRSATFEQLPAPPDCVTMSEVPLSPFAGLFRVIGYGFLGGAALVAVVVLASLLQGDLAKAWAAEMRRMRRKSL